MNIKYNVYLCTRDAKDNIRQVLDSIIEQSIPPENIFIYDDCSWDGTRDILLEYKKHYNNIRLSLLAGYTEKDSGRLTYNINKLFNRAEQLGLINTRFDFIAADDVVLPKDYCQRLIEQMDDNIVVASGISETDKNIRSPRGIRVIDSRMYDNPLCCLSRKWSYNIGHESAIIYEAMRLGYDVKVLHDLKFKHLRDNGANHKFVPHGKAIRALGYSKLYFFGLLIVNLLTGLSFPRTKVYNVLISYLSYKEKNRLPIELQKYIKSKQHEMIREYIKQAGRMIRYSGCFFVGFFFGLIFFPLMIVMGILEDYYDRKKSGRYA